MTPDDRRTLTQAERGMDRVSGTIISFTVYGKSEPQGSTRAFIRGGRPITTSDNKGLKAWREDVANVAQQHIPPDGLLDGAVVLRVRFVFFRPKSVSAKKRPHHTVKPDLDKLIRAIGDALKGKIYTEDARVVKIEALKVYGDQPRVDIMVYPYEA